MKRWKLALVILPLLLVSWNENANAVLNRIFFDVFTQRNPSGDILEMQLYIYDDVYARGPDCIKTIVIKAPDGSTFNVHPRKDYDQTDGSYYKSFVPSNFTGGMIVGGTYTVTVTPLTGSAIAETDAIIGTTSGTAPPAKFLEVPTVVAPTPINGAVNVVETPTFKWNPVVGAAHYRIRLWDNTANTPVYWGYIKPMRTDFTTFKVPVGELKPNHQYKLRIEARSGSQDLDLRSFTNWIVFTTGTW